jgi:adenosylmethionine-8-amino-7-oxononanoate aminotransferase
MVERLQAELVTELQAVAVQQLLDKLQQVQHQDKVMVEQAQQHQFQDHLLHTLVVEVEVNGVLVALDLVEQVAVELEDLVQEVLPQEQMEVPIEVVEVAEETQMVLQQVAKEDLV